MASNGLDRQEIKKLTWLNVQIDAILERERLLGGNEVRDLSVLREKISLRLNPPMPASLELQFNEQLKNLAGLEWVEKALASVA